ncbi:MAG: type II toxin-antitoxin system VapC family toxin [Bacteroidota bacterium]|nr:type II toxin-antitoxin system VapC family toxin [Bacteroidota bacterium]
MAKKKIICDTDVMIDYWDQTKPRHLATKSTLEKFIELDNVVLSAVTKMELMLGATNKTDMLSITKKLSRFNIALINNHITLQAFNLLQNYRLSHGLSLPDSIIAATALIADLELFTYNTKDFKFISRLKLHSF